MLNKCLTNILRYNDDDNDNDCLPIMTTSSYYENDNYMSLINAKTNSLGILSTHNQCTNAKFNYTLDRLLCIFKTNT